MGTNKKTIKTHARYSATPTGNTNHQGDFFSQINTEITKHDTATSYMVSNDMLIPYINKLGKSGADNTRLSDKQLEIIKSILSDNRILLYFDQYLNIHNRINNTKPNTNNIKIINEKDLSTHFFELPILMDIFKQLRKPSEFTINNITAMYYQAVWERLIPIQRQLQIENEKIDQMEQRMLFIHGIERTNMFIVPDDVIICKLVSYNYTGAVNNAFVSKLTKTVLSHYKNNNILNSSCCTKDGAVSIFFPNQLCNDTDFDIYKFQFYRSGVINFQLLKNYLGLFSLNDKNKLVQHKLSNYDFKNILMKRIKLSNLILDKEVKNKILIIFCCRNPEIGTIVSYTEFNYRLERLQLLLSRPFCNCANIQLTEYKLQSNLLNFFYTKYAQTLQFIYDYSFEYTPFYDTYLSTDITKTFLKPKNMGKSLKLDDIIENPAILKSLPIYKRATLFGKIYKLYSDDTTTTPQILDVLSILLMNLINNSYKFRKFKFETDAEILAKSKFYYKLLDTLYANNSLNITKCSELLKLTLQQLQIFLLQSFRLQQNHPSTAKSLSSDRKASRQQIITKHTTKLSANKRNSKSRKQTTTRLISGSPKTKPNHLIEYTIKLLDLYYKLSNRFGRKIKKTIIQIINQDEFRLVINQVSQLLINQPNLHSGVIPISPNELHKMTSNLSKLCNGCLDAKPSTSIQGHI